ncbi:hypothetical protein H4Q26_017242 [Puccinia striiformis f. sp. tritici PST-130]|nr:hypothetical protein H4Q26_017242 [Puccinia striiformis f. sp. tritici PST-130]
MDNSHQDPGITRGGPPGPAINPTITQEETVMEEMEELVMEALEMVEDSAITHINSPKFSGTVFTKICRIQ